MHGTMNIQVKFTLVSVLKYMVFVFKDSHVTDNTYESYSVKPPLIISLRSS